MTWNFFNQNQTHTFWNIFFCLCVKVCCCPEFAFCSHKVNETWGKYHSINLSFEVDLKSRRNCRHERKWLVKPKVSKFCVWSGFQCSLPVFEKLRQCLQCLIDWEELWFSITSGSVQFLILLCHFKFDCGVSSWSFTPSLLERAAYISLPCPLGSLAGLIGNKSPVVQERSYLLTQIIILTGSHCLHSTGSHLGLSLHVTSHSSPMHPYIMTSVFCICKKQAVYAKRRRDRLFVTLKAILWYLYVMFWD